MHSFIHSLMCVRLSWLLSASERKLFKVVQGSHASWEVLESLGFFL